MSFLLGQLTNLAATIFVLGVIIFCHEFGHFITAKAFGMRVFVFSFGFGQRLLGFKWGDTDLRLSLIPLGGYVKLEGEPDDRISEDTTHIGDGQDFIARPRWQRILVYLAGPFMNGVLTVAALALVYALGTAVLAWPFERPIIGIVAPGSPAERAGLQTGDELVAMNGQPVPTWEDVVVMVSLRPDTDLRVRYRRGEAEREIAVRSGTDARRNGEIGVHPLVFVGALVSGSPAEKTGIREADAILRIDGTPIRAFQEISPIVSKANGKSLAIELYRAGARRVVDVVPGADGRIGVGPKQIVKKYPPLQALGEAVREAGRITVQTVTMLRQIATREISLRAGLGGPLQIHEAASQAVRSGHSAMLYLVAILSLSVGILNLLPVPPLDGGHLAILYGEAIARRDLSADAKMRIINTGAVLVLLLIVTVVYFDLTKTNWFTKLFG